VKRLVLILLTVGALASGVNALEVKSGRMKLVLHEDIGRFSLYYLEDLKQDTYVPLFLDQDPRTSFITVLENNRIHKMGETGGFTLSTEKTAQGARFIWKSSSVEVVEDFKPATAQGGRLAAGLRISLQITNTSEKTSKIGARFLVDTYLGEKSGIHFKTAQKNSYSHEAEIIPSAAQWYVLSPSSDYEDVALQTMLFGGGVTVPSRVVLANWKRLTESPWDYQVNPSRNFNLLPYSIDDSAEALYYNPVSVDRGQTREIVILLGNAASGGYSVESTSDSGLSDLLGNEASAAPASTGGSTPGTTRGTASASPYHDLVAVNDILREIDRLLGANTPVTEQDLAVIENALEKLRSLYGEQER